MARIAGIDLPRQKHINIALTYIYGIGQPRAGRILDEAKVEPMKKVQDLSAEEVNRIRTVIEQEGLKVCAGHYPYPSIGSIIRVEGKRRWQGI